jgi:predicted transcriptional regulator
MGHIFRRASSKLSSCKQRRVLTDILPLVDTNDSVEKLTLLILGHTLLQSSRTKSSVA